MKCNIIKYSHLMVTGLFHFFFLVHFSIINLQRNGQEQLLLQIVLNQLHNSYAETLLKEQFFSLPKHTKISIIRYVKFYTILNLVCVCVFSCSVMSDSFATLRTVARQASLSRRFSRQIQSCHFLLQKIFTTQGSNPHLLCLLHWQMDSLNLIFY